MSPKELLAPAGTLEILKTAVQAGADAVYIGGEKFSARASAGNFSNQDIQEALDYCHSRSKKVYVAANTILFDEEREAFIQYVGFLYEAGVDALIMQDIGMAKLVHTLFPDLPLHASTQMTNNSHYDLQVLKDIGFSRAVLSRELSLKEIEEIARHTDLQIEAFIHGALCMSYSGKCLMSYMAGGRSANRGKCAQPCRQSYEIIKDSGKETSFVLSTKDLSSIEQLDKLCEAPITCFKIEGRMKRAEYVYAVTRIYRQLIDARNQTDSPESLLENKDIHKLFNRGFTAGFIGASLPADISNPSQVTFKGQAVAQVLTYDRVAKKLTLRLLDTLTVGDGLSSGERVGRILQDGKTVQTARSGQTVCIDSIKKIANGEVLYKTFDQELSERIYKSQEQPFSPKQPLYAVLEAKIGEKACFTFSDGVFSGTAQSLDTLQAALYTTYDSGRVTLQLNKMGNAPYYVADTKLQVDPRVHLSVGVLNALRREALLDYQKARLQNFKRISPLSARERPGVLLKDIRPVVDLLPARLSVVVQTYDQFKACLSFFPQRIYFKSRSLLETALQEFPRQADCTYCFILPRIIQQCNVEEVRDLTLGLSVPFLFSSSGVPALFPKHPLLADYPLNLTNSASHNFYHEQGIETTASLELVFSEKWLEETSCKKVEIPLYLYPDLMMTQYCPNGSRVSCQKDCEQKKLFRNRKEETFYFQKDFGCRQVLRREKPYFLSEASLKKYRDRGHRLFRIELAEETGKDTQRLLKKYTALLKS